MLRLKMLILAFLSLLLIGCSKDPVEPEKTPVLYSVTLTDSLYALNNDAFTRECQIDINLVYKIQNFSLIQSYSDSENVYIYLHNGKIITEPFNCFGLLIDEAIPGLLTRTIQSGWISDTTAYLLTASDTLTTIDSSVVDIWWWYNGSRQSFHRKF